MPQSALMAPNATSLATTAVLKISGMPRTLRPAVETAMCMCLPTPSSAEPDPGTDIWDTRWWTRWRNDNGRLSCREVLDAPADELEDLRQVLSHMAKDHDFGVSLQATYSAQ